MYYDIKRRLYGEGYDIYGVIYEGPKKIGKELLASAATYQVACALVEPMEEEVAAFAEKHELKPVVMMEYLAVYHYERKIRYYEDRSFADFAENIYYFPNLQQAFAFYTKEWGKDRIIQEMSDVDIRDLIGKAKTIPEYWLNRKYWYALPSGAYIHSIV